MAKLEIDPNQWIECTDYFEGDKWLYFQSQLNIVGRAVKQITKEFGLSEFKDSRWPTRGIKKKKFGVTNILKICLNRHYLDPSKSDYNQEFYQLRFDQIFYNWHFFYKSYKSGTSTLLRNFSQQEIQNFELMYEKIKSSLYLLNDDSTEDNP